MSQISESIIEVCQDNGLVFKRVGKYLYSSCPFHQDGKRPNFRVTVEQNVWYCDVCGVGGSVVEFLAMKQGRPKKEVFKELVGKNGNGHSNGHTPLGEISQTYDYKDRFGNLTYQVCRMVPKDFRQRRPDGKGGWIWNMEGVERVLYRLDEVQNPTKPFVWIVEGEKDVETLRTIGIVATTNVGGAGKWLDGYGPFLAGKEIVLCGDNNEVGKKHMATVMEKIELHAKSIRKVDLPAQFVDVSDFAAAFNSREKFAEALAPLVDSAQVMIRGGFLPIKNMAQLEEEYRAEIELARKSPIKLSSWIPALSNVRPLVPGELVSIVADTGTGKTYVLQHIALHCQVPTLLFELELPGSLTFERFVAVARQTPGEDVYRTYEVGGALDYHDISHVYTCTRSRMSPQDIEDLIVKSELRIGRKPLLVMVDYVQLVRGNGSSKYDRVSDAAEELKVIAKNTGTVVIMSSQIARDKDSPEVTLHDAKGSGSIENSSSLAIGIWRDKDDSSILCLRVLKNTKGKPGRVIRCKILDDSMRIVPLSPVSEEPQMQTEFRQVNSTYPDP